MLSLSQQIKLSVCVLQDIFYANQETTPVDNIQDTITSRKNLLRFLHGRPFHWPYYGLEKQVTNITAAGFRAVTLPTNLESRYGLINKVVLDPANGV